MSSFLDFLIGYVQKEFSEAANSNDTSEFRACFKGPPTRVLDSLYTALSTGRQLDIAGNAGLIHIPVFYLDPNAQDPPTFSLPVAHGATW